MAEIVGNISTASDDHRRFCLYPSANSWSRPGDVRRCRHGRVQLGYDMPGSAQAYWRDLSPVFTPILYRRAIRVLHNAEEGA